MRIAAIIAGIAQLLLGLYSAAPQVFGFELYSPPGQIAFNIYLSLFSFVLLLFFIGVVENPVPNLTRGVKVASLAAAVALTLENLMMSFNSIRYAAVLSMNSTWESHPVKQFALVLGGLIPTLAVITLVFFFVVVFVKCFSIQISESRVQERTGFLRLTSLATGAVTPIGLGAALFSTIRMSGSLANLAVPIFLRFATLISLAVFFLIFGLNQRQVKAASAEG